MSVLQTTNNPDLTNTAKTLKKINPTNGELIAEYLTPDTQMIQTVVANSRQAFRQWQHVSLPKRAEIFKALSKAIKNQADELAELISLENGKPLHDSYQADVITAASVFNYYAKVGPKELAEKPMDAAQGFWLGRQYESRRAPYGVAAIISPWNYPLGIPASGIAAALMAGNTVILKPSELTPGVAKQLVEIIQSVLAQFKLNTDIVQCVIGEGETGKTLVDSDINYVIFTGSTTTGQAIQQALIPRGIRFSMEMGGNCPMVILDSCSDWDAALSTALWGRMMNAGQSCAAVKRLFVPQAKLNDVLALLTDKASQLIVDSYENPAAHLGPLISAQQRDDVHALVQDAIANGANCVVGGKAMNKPGYFYQPTILTTVNDAARIKREECFGPVLSVYGYNSVAEAIAMANDIDYGLTASVFGAPKDAALIAPQLEASSVGINEVPLVNYGFPQLPWQGWKQSGPGCSHSIKALLEATQEQVIVTNNSWAFPLLRKAPWLFSQPGSIKNPLALPKKLLNWMVPDSILDTLNPTMVLDVWKNRSKNKI